MLAESHDRARHLNTFLTISLQVLSTRRVRGTYHLFWGRRASPFTSPVNFLRPLYRALRAPVLVARSVPTARRGEPTRRRLGKCIPNPSCLTPYHKKPGHAPAEKTAPLNQSRLGRAPVGTMPSDQFTRHCGARKIYWHHLIGSVEG